MSRSAPSLAEAVKNGLFTVHAPSDRSERTLWYKDQGQIVGPIDFPTQDALQAFLDKARMDASQVG